MVKLHDPKFIKTDEASWLEARQLVVSATDVSALLGLNRYKNANDVRKEKKYGREEPDDVAKLYFKLGHQWEEHILKHALTLLPGEEVLHTQAFYTLDSIKLGATPDTVLKSGKLIEAKATALKNMRHWENAAPTPYVLQAHAQMLATGAKEVYLIGMFFKNWPSESPEPAAVMMYRIKRHEGLRKKIIDKVRHFWHHYDNDDYTYRVLKKEKEESEQMTIESTIHLRTENFGDVMPRDAIPEKEKTIIRQAILNALHDVDVDAANYMPVSVAGAERFTIADAIYEVVLSAVDLSAKYPGTERDHYIAIQSAMKRHVGRVAVEGLLDLILQDVEYTFTGKVS